MLVALAVAKAHKRQCLPCPHHTINNGWMWLYMNTHTCMTITVSTEDMYVIRHVKSLSSHQQNLKQMSPLHRQILQLPFYRVSQLNNVVQQYLIGNDSPKILNMAKRTSKLGCEHHPTGWMTYDTHLGNYKIYIKIFSNVM